MDRSSLRVLGDWLIRLGLSEWDFVVFLRDSIVKYRFELESMLYCVVALCLK